LTCSIVYQLRYAALKAAFDKESGLTATSYDYESFEDPVLMRQFRKIADIGEAVLPEEEFDRVSSHRFVSPEIADVTTRTAKWSSCRDAAHLQHSNGL
jgi:hypothetical protein